MQHWHPRYWVWTFMTAADVGGVQAGTPSCLEVVESGGDALDNYIICALDSSPLPVLP